MISVIVPVYKVEKYLSECIDSILAQSYKDFELILVDDGSPDNCGEICDSYAEKDNRILVIHQENRGLSGARNSGIKKAKGDYLTFIDSDDMVSPDYLETLYELAQRTEADITTGQFQYFEDGSKPVYSGIETADVSVITSAEACKSVYSGARRVTVNAICKLFIREMFSDLSFPEGKLHEDQAVIPIALYRASRVAVTEKVLYYYRERTDSITNTKFTRKRYDDIWAIDRCISFFEEKHELEIANEAKKKRKRLIAVYSIYAKRDKVTVPSEYKVPLLDAVLFLRKTVSSEKYGYYLSQIHPVLGKMHEYVVKIQSVLKNDQGSKK